MRCYVRLQDTVRAQLYDLGQELDEGQAKDLALNLQVEVQADYQMIEQDFVLIVWIELSHTVIKEDEGALRHRVLSHADTLTCLRNR